MGPSSQTSLQLEPIESLFDVREQWTLLAQSTGHPFATWEWNECWWRWFGLGRELCSFACRDDDGRVVGILPLYLAGARPLRVARFLGYGDLHSPICAPADRPRVARALLASLDAPGGCPLVVAERLPCEQGWGELLGGRVLARLENPVLTLSGLTWEGLLASRSRNFREQVRRKERRLVAERGLTFRLAEDPARLEEDLDALFRLHASRWGEQSTGVFDADQGMFHREFAAIALRRGWLRLWLGELDGEPVAAWYGWRFAGVEWYFQAGRDPRFDDLSLGFVMMVHTLREACRDGMSAYNFLAGGDEYKSRFTQEDPGCESRVLSSGPTAALAGGAMRFARSLPDSARQRVKSIAG